MNQPRLSPEQRKAEEKCMKELEMMYSRIFKEVVQREHEKMLREEPRLATMTEEEIITQDEMRRATCELCGMVLKSREHMLQHKDMLKCRKRQAANKGEDYVPEQKRPVHCDVCDKTVQQRRWDQHIQSKAHKLNVMLKSGVGFQCFICDKPFEGKRAKRGLKDHMCCNMHLKKVVMCPLNREKHDTMVKKYGFKFNTAELIKKMKAKKAIKQRETTSATPPRPLPSSADHEQCVPCPPTSSIDPEQADHCKVAKETRPQPRVLEV